MKRVDDVLKQFRKSYGDRIFSSGDLGDLPRIQTGVFPLDFALGGGLPRGKMSVIYGPKDSGKTLLTYKIIAGYQRLNPDKRCVFVDIETNYDKKWAASIGVDTDQLTVIAPHYAEQAVDIVEALMYADDIGIVVLDSIAALMTQNELDSSAEKAIVGGNSIVVSKLVKKANKAMYMEGRENIPTFICINQLRVKIGGNMYGPQEVLPGGFALEFQASLILRVYGKCIVDKKYHATKPVKMETSCIVKKYKFPICAMAAKYNVAVHPHAGLNVGDVEDWNTIKYYLKKGGMLKAADKGSGWECLGQVYKSQNDLYYRILNEPEFEQDIKGRLFELGHTLADTEEAE